MPPYFAGQFLDEVGKVPSRLRVAVIPEKIGSGSYSPEIQAALQDSAKLMADLGHDVIEATPEVDGLALQFASGALLGANLALKVTEQLENLGRSLEDGDLEPGTRGLIEYGKTLNAEACAKASQIGSVNNLSHFVSRLAP